MKRVLVIGELNVDLIVSGLASLPKLGQELVCTDLSRVLGSSSAIFSRALAGLGAQVGFMGKVGEDENGRFMIGQLQELGIDTSDVLVDPGTQTGITISLTYPGEKAQITYPGSISEYGPGEVNTEAFPRYDHLHMASMYLQTGLRPGMPELLRRARELGLSTSLDPGWDPAERWGEDLFEALEAVDILFLNEHEAKAIGGHSSARSAAEVIAGRVPIVLCKMGAGGALMAAGKETIRVPAHPVTVLDTTGAGDSFDAGFIYRHVVQERPILDSLYFANACGAIAVTRVGGASSVPSATEVEAYLAARSAGSLWRRHRLKSMSCGSKVCRSTLSGSQITVRNSMKPLDEVVRRVIDLREQGIQLTLLAVCPNSAAVLEAAVKVAAENNTPMLFAATLNQVDRDGGYTGWTPATFVEQIHAFAGKHRWEGPLYPCLDHGGPWLKDLHTSQGLSLEATMEEVKRSLVTCLEAGYQLLHVDPTVDRTLPAGTSIAIETVIERTAELIEHTERVRLQMGLPPIAYEVGTEEVAGGLVDYDNFCKFIGGLRQELEERGLQHAWPCFIVGRVGTDLHTSDFAPEDAGRLFDIVSPLGSLIKGHYTDWVSNPEDYPASGMGGANVGPEFTSEEYLALEDLCAKERDLCRNRPDVVPSELMVVLEMAVRDSGRWRKWLHGGEDRWDDLSPERRAWLTQTGARYIWTHPAVVSARETLYGNLARVIPDPHHVVVDRIAQSMEKYVVAFRLFDSLTLLP